MIDLAADAVASTTLATPRQSCRAALPPRSRPHARPRRVLAGRAPSVMSSTSGEECLRDRGGLLKRACSGSPSACEAGRAPFPRSRRRRASAITRSPGFTRRRAFDFSGDLEDDGVRLAGRGRVAAEPLVQVGAFTPVARTRTIRSPSRGWDRALRRAAGLRPRVASRRWRAWASLTMKGCPHARLRILDDRQRELIFLRPPRRTGLAGAQRDPERARAGGRRPPRRRTRYCDAPSRCPWSANQGVDVDAGRGCAPS